MSCIVLTSSIASAGSAWPLWSVASIPAASRACFSGSEARTCSFFPSRTMLKNALKGARSAIVEGGDAAAAQEKVNLAVKTLYKSVQVPVKKLVKAGY